MNRLKLMLSVLVLGLLLAACGGGGGGGATTGNLQVTISGLPSGTNATVSVSGPNGYHQGVTASTTLKGLAVGSYTVTASPVTASGTTYNATVTGSPAKVAANQTAQVSVTYAASGGGGGGGTGGTLSGTVSAPSGGDVQGTVVEACFISNAQCDEDSANTKQVTVQQSGASAPYSIGGLAAGQYALFACKDINGDNQCGDGDYYGFYTTDGQNPAAVTPPAANLNIQMVVQGGGGGGGGGQAGTIAGTIYAPSGGDVANTVVAACPLSNNTYDCTAAGTKTITISQSGASASYTLSGLTDQQPYAMLAGKDVNGNQQLDDGDYQGGYPDLDNLQAVTPPASGIDIHMVVYSSGGSGGGSGGGGGGGSNPNITFLKPSDFQNGTATVTLSNLGTNENVAVIPAYATQDLNPDGMDYSIGVSGISPQSMPASLAPQALSPRQQKALELEQNHLKRLEKSTEEANKLLKAGVKPLSSGGLKTQSIGKCLAPYTTGSTQCSFWITPDNTQTQITATLEYESANAYWFVQNDDISDLSQSDLANLAQVFENTIVPSDNKYFGNFPDVDGNGKIFIVFNDLIGPAGVLGYVNPVDLFPDSQAYPQLGEHSNEGDIFYAATPSSLGQGSSRSDYFSTTMPATMVHELKHLISDGVRLLHNPPNSPEELWIEEPSAVAAEELAGLGSQKDEIQGYARYGLAAPQDFRVVYQGRPSDFEGGLGIYGYNFTLLWRIAEEVGHDNFWKAWTAGPGTGIANLEAHSGGRTFPDMMEDWAVMLLLDHTNQTGGLADYSYQGINLRDGTWEDLGYQPLKDGISGTTRSLAYYIGKGQGGDATITISSSASAPYAVVVRYGTALSWDPRDGTMAGTVYAPSGGDVSGATLEACYVENGHCNENSANTVFGTIDQSGASFAYSISEMHYGSYLVYAFQDINNDGTLDAGDSYNCYTTDNVHCATVNVNPDASGIDVHMVTLTSQAISSLPTLRAFPRRSNLHPLEGNPAPLFKH